MNRTFKLLASAAIVGLSLTAGHAAELPLPPHVSFVATPASQLLLGMTADDVTRVMGKAARETEFTVSSMRIRKLEFKGAIPGQVILKEAIVPLKAASKYLATGGFGSKPEVAADLRLFRFSPRTGHRSRRPAGPWFSARDGHRRFVMKSSAPGKERGHQLRQPYFCCSGCNSAFCVSSFATNSLIQVIVS
jgi:hypothetical protein